MTVKEWWQGRRLELRLMAGRVTIEIRYFDGRVKASFSGTSSKGYNGDMAGYGDDIPQAVGELIVRYARDLGFILKEAERTSYGNPRSPAVGSSSTVYPQ